MVSEEIIKEIELKAIQIRREVINMLVEAGSGHSAGSLGMADVFAVIYFSGLVNVKADDSWGEERDRVLLSNGHICPVWYATLAEAGFFPKEELSTLRKLGSKLQGHPHYKELPGVENSGGPLGQGLSQAVGQAMAARMDAKTWKVYCLMSDGELDEGQSWEAIMMAGKYELGNLTAIVDRNNIQIDGFTEDVMTLEPLVDKFEAFNWKVIEVDGNEVKEVVVALERSREGEKKPTVIIAKTVPGKGVDFMEWKSEWHGKTPNKEEARKALTELRTLQGKIKSESE